MTATEQMAPRRPVQVLYGGAHLFTAESPAKLGRLARQAMDVYGADDDAFAAAVGLKEPHAIVRLAERVRAKLAREPIESMCIDFEDGYGPRPDAEEDDEAVRAAMELARAAVAPGLPTIGMRIKAMDTVTGRRALLTLDRFVSTLAKETGGAVPPGFTVTLPKVTKADEVTALAEALTTIERASGLQERSVGIELMVEAPRALYDAEGRLALPSLVAAADGRCVAAHLGAYDLTASLGVAATEQTLDHPFCDTARTLMCLALAGTRVSVVDGATTQLPFARFRASAEAPLSVEQVKINVSDIHRAWSVHAANVTRALRFGIHQGWDLHPAQLPARYGALYAFFLHARERMADRLEAFVANATKATRAGQVFDDAATGQGLLVFFLRGIECGALDETDLLTTGLSLDEVRSRSFAKIVAARTAGHV